MSPFFAQAFSFFDFLAFIFYCILLGALVVFANLRRVN